MSHAGFVALAYAVFAVVLVWDYLTPRFRLRHIRQNIALRGRRETARTPL